MQALGYMEGAGTEARDECQSRSDKLIAVPPTLTRAPAEGWTTAAVPMEQPDRRGQGGAGRLHRGRELLPGGPVIAGIPPAQVRHWSRHQTGRRDNSPALPPPRLSGQTNRTARSDTGSEAFIASRRGLLLQPRSARVPVLNLMSINWPRPAAARGGGPRLSNLSYLLECASRPWARHYNRKQREPKWSHDPCRRAADWTSRPRVKAKGHRCPTRAPPTTGSSLAGGLCGPRRRHRGLAAFARRLHMGLSGNRA